LSRFRRQSIPFIFIFSVGLAIISPPNAFVSAQKADSNNVERADKIKNLIVHDPKLTNICPNDITFDLKGEELRVITGNHVCSYKIIQNVLQPQLKAGEIQHYDFSDDQDNLIVTFSPNT
jgi:hypothetical protein